MIASMITPNPRNIEAALRAAAPRITDAILAVYLPLLIDYLPGARIYTPRAIAALLANLAHESGDFRHVSENLNYSAKGLRATFGRRIDDETALALHRKPEQIANAVYANRLGNGNCASGDGWRYRGRGLIQITGRDNYLAVGKALAVNLLDSPEILEQPVYALKSALWFWASRGLTGLAEADKFRSVVVRINGGTNGFDDRKARYTAALAALTQKDV
jgi:putative chitinase